MPIELEMPSNHLILYHLLLFLPSMLFSIKVFSDEFILCIRWPSVGDSASPSVLPVLRVYYLQDWLVWHLSCPSYSQEFSPEPQFKNINSWVLSLLYGPTLTYLHDQWKTIAFTRRCYVSNVTSMLFNMLFKFVISFLPRRKCLLISWMQSPSTLTLEPKKTKFAIVSIFSLHLFVMMWWHQMSWS